MTFTVARILFFIVAIVGTFCLLPFGAAVYYNENEQMLPFLVPCIAGWILCAFFLIMGKRKKSSLSIRGSFATVFLAWIMMCITGSLPFIFGKVTSSFTDAFFESASGFTTTGISIFNDVESLPKSINLWRCLMHWIGGMGIIALTVALLPLLGVGGFQLIKAETTGPEKGKLTARITTTAKILWFIYLAMTILQTILLKISGMDLFDALCHSLSTLGTGGFSTKNASIGWYDSFSIDMICAVFMFLSGISFSMYYYLIIKDINQIKSNTELKHYAAIVLSSTLIIAFLQFPESKSFLQALRIAFFQVASVITTTGFSTADYTSWKDASQAIILALFFIGGCAGSTSGGVKVIRWVILLKQAKNEIKKLLHPHGIFSIRLNGKPGRKDFVYTVSAFFFLYFLLVFATTFFACLSGIDLFTSFSGAISMIGNVGPGFNRLGPSFNASWLPVSVKWWYSIIMIAGRLEIFSVFVFFSKDFWRK